MTKSTMQAVVFKGPLEIALEQKPIPKIQDPGDVILKVRYTALCGRQDVPLAILRLTHEMQSLTLF